MDIYQQPEDSAGEDLDDDLGDGDKDDSEEDEDEEGDSKEGEAIRRRREYGAAGRRRPAADRTEASRSSAPFKAASLVL